MKTRTKRGQAHNPTKTKQEDEEEAKPTSIAALAPSVKYPPSVCVLPKNLSNEARIMALNVSISEDRSESRRFLVCPQHGFFEFKRVAGNSLSHRSWLLTPKRSTSETNSIDHAEHTELRDGPLSAQGDPAYAIRSAGLLVATPLDPLFLLLACPDVLWPNVSMGNQEYLSIDTRLGVLRTQNEHLDHLIRDDPQTRIEQRLKRRIQAVCNVEEIPGEDMEPTYCLSLPKLYSELVKIARRVIQKGLPKSMEQQFVKSQLQLPEIYALQGGNSNVEGDESEHTTATPPQVTKEVQTLMQTRLVIEYMMGSYLPLELRTSLRELMESDIESASIDFRPLREHLARVVRLRQESQALRSLSDNISRKRSAFEDEEALQRAEAKKQKKEEDEFKKKNTSRGVQQLAKADTSGMKKLSAFFTKAPGKK